MKVMLITWSDMTKSIGWFTTGRGPGSLGLFSMMMSKIKSGEIDAKLSFVFINREVKGNHFRAKLISMAEEDGIPVIILPSDGFRSDLKQKNMSAWRDAYGTAMRDQISRYDMDFGVLAGYMLILDPKTCQQYDIINLHPALPNTYQGTWEEIVRRVALGEDRTYGAMVHICTPELDRGETVAYDEFDINDMRKTYRSPDELSKAIRDMGVRREAPLLMETIRSIVDGDMIIRDGEVFDRNGAKSKEHRCLSRTIDELLN